MELAPLLFLLVAVAIAGAAWWWHQERQRRIEAALTELLGQQDAVDLLGHVPAQFWRAIGVDASRG